MLSELPKRSDEPSLIVWFEVEPVVIFDLMSHANAERAGYASQPPDSGNFVPQNLSSLPKPAEEETPGCKLPVAGSINYNSGEASKDKNRGTNFGPELHWRTAPQKL